MILAWQMFKNRFELIEFEEPLPYVVLREHRNVRHGRHHALPEPEPKHAFQRSEFAVNSRWCRLVLQTKRLVPLDSCGRDVDGLRSAKRRIESRQSRGLQIAETLPAVIRIVGDD